MLYGLTTGRSEPEGRAKSTDSPLASKQMAPPLPPASELPPPLPPASELPPPLPPASELEAPDANAEAGSSAGAAPRNGDWTAIWSAPYVPSLPPV